ncbi:hypothetical protein OQA88_9148 [Cercophora sp. LCS_1]
MKGSKITGWLHVLGTAVAFPSVNELKAAVTRRRFEGSTELLGDLAMLSQAELSNNVAMNGVGTRMKAIYAKDKPFGINMADLLQCDAKVGVLACPGGPRIRLFVGRLEDATAAPIGKLPPASFTADQIIDLFASKTLSPGGIVALVGAHTASRKHSATTTSNVAPPQDLTPGNDVSLANSPRTGPVFQQFSAQKGAWDEAYAREYIRMSLMGVKTINTLRECTKAMPLGDKPGHDPTPSRTPTTNAAPVTAGPGRISAGLFAAAAGLVTALFSTLAFQVDHSDSAAVAPAMASSSNLDTAFDNYNSSDFEDIDIILAEEVDLTAHNYIPTPIRFRAK